MINPENPNLLPALLATIALVSAGVILWRMFPDRTIERAGKRKDGKKVRVFIDGCFDVMHYGHANALRQAKALGDELFVGVVSDEEIRANKGPPVMSMTERLSLVESVKWVDAVIPATPYCINEAFLNRLYNEYGVDYIIHGDDPCILPDGSDAYALPKAAGRYKEIKRTEGVSSTDIVGRMLQCVSSGQVAGGDGPLPKVENESEDSQRISHFLPTSRRIVQFSNNQSPPLGARIVYCDGAFDLFHAGHVETLKEARSLGDFLLVGLHTDATVSSRRGSDHPIMTLHERALSVMSCRHVDEVIIGAPGVVTKDMLTTFNISLVAHGSSAEPNPLSDGMVDPYAVPRAAGILKIIESKHAITGSMIMKRIAANHEAYVARNKKKVASESKYYDNKEFVAE